MLARAFKRGMERPYYPEVFLVVNQFQLPLQSALYQLKLSCN